jgi:hypothetical protein
MSNNDNTRRESLSYLTATFGADNVTVYGDHTTYRVIDGEIIGARHESAEVVVKVGDWRIRFVPLGNFDRLLLMGAYNWVTGTEYSSPLRWFANKCDKAEKALAPKVQEVEVEKEPTAAEKIAKLDAEIAALQEIVDYAANMKTGDDEVQEVEVDQDQAETEAWISEVWDRIEEERPAAIAAEKEAKAKRAEETPVLDEGLQYIPTVIEILGLTTNMKDLQDEIDRIQKNYVQPSGWPYRWARHVVDAIWYAPESFEDAKRIALEILAVYLPEPTPDPSPEDRRGPGHDALARVEASHNAVLSVRVTRDQAKALLRRLNWIEMEAGLGYGHADGLRAILEEVINSQVRHPAAGARIYLDRVETDLLDDVLTWTIPGANDPTSKPDAEKIDRVLVKYQKEVHRAPWSVSATI